MDGPLTLLHVSDFQCGKPFLPDAAEAMHRVFRTVEPDLVVASGDLTQRAKVREFELARDVLDGFGEVPIVLTPGNHDVPLYRVWERIAVPFRNWRRFAGEALDTVTTIPGATVVALSSAAPRRAIVNGRIHPRQIEFARRAFERADEGDVRVLVVHHHFVPVPDGEGGRTLPGAEKLATAFAAMGVDVVLGGHVHQLHVNSWHQVPFVATGTTTSRRGRGAEARANSLCVHRIEQESLSVTPYHRAFGETDFEASAPLEFSARPASRRWLRRSSST